MPFGVGPLELIILALGVVIIVIIISALPKTPSGGYKAIPKQLEEGPMHCRNCGKEVHPQAVVCPACGVPPLLEKKFCQNCGTETQPNQAMCTSCGVSLAQKSATGEKSKVAAGLLAILLGSLGIHKFYLGYTTAGVVMLIVSIIGACVTLGIGTLIVEVIALVEGIIYLTKSDEEFDRIYVQGKRAWF